jgi:hypothetical protein
VLAYCHLSAAYPSSQGKDPVPGHSLFWFHV